jgi:hypothetical protein
MGRVARIMAVRAVARKHEEAGREAGREEAEAKAKTEAEAKAKTEEVPGLKDVYKVEIHIVEDIDYPAAREDVIKAFEGFKDVDPSDKEWVSKHLPEGTYKNDDEVIHAMGLKYTLIASGHKGGEAKGAAAGAME